MGKLKTEYKNKTDTLFFKWESEHLFSAQLSYFLLGINLVVFSQLQLSKAHTRTNYMEVKKKKTKKVLVLQITVELNNWEIWIVAEQLQNDNYWHFIL